jgi:homoserine O-acetyltransferase
MGKYYHTIEGEFSMKKGILHSPQIAFETWGTLNNSKDNAVLVFTGLSPSAHIASSVEDNSPGWWEDMVGPGKPIDTRQYYVICVNSLGSCFGSTGAASINPNTGQMYRLDFPQLCIEDIAKSSAELIRAMNINSLYATVGASMGGMTALAFCILYPELSRSLMSISSAARALPFAIALRSLQREIIREDPDWENGLYPLDAPPASGMRLARKLGMISYRSAREWETRFARERASSSAEVSPGPFQNSFEIESYLEHQANAFIGKFDTNCYLYLSQAMDLFDAADFGGCLEQAFSKLKIERAKIIGVTTDILFPIQQQKELSELLSEVVKDVSFDCLESVQGHDSFLVDMDRFRPAISGFFAN